MKVAGLVLGLLVVAVSALRIWCIVSARMRARGEIWLESTRRDGREYRYAQRVTLPAGRQIKVGFLIHLPATYEKDEETAWPLVLFLHGSGESGRDLDQVAGTGLAQRAREVDLSFIVLAPQCPREDDWTYEGQRRRVMGLIDFVVARYRVDSRRIYLTGNSMGGYAVWSLAARYPDRFAAIIPICGSTGTGIAATIKHIPAWVFHGALDQAVSVNASRKIVAALRACGAPVTYTEYTDGAHNVWDRAYREPELFEWMLVQHLPQ